MLEVSIRSELVSIWIDLGEVEVSYICLVSIRIDLGEFEVSYICLVSIWIDLGEFEVSYICLVSIRIDLGEFEASYICLVQFEAIWVTYNNEVNTKWIIHLFSTRIKELCLRY